MVINTDKMRQVITSIQEVGITNLTIPNLARILSILNEDEIDELIKRSYKIFGYGISGSVARKMLETAKPIAISSYYWKLKDIENSDVIKELNKAIKEDNLDAFFNSKTTLELGQIKYYILHYLVKMKQEETYKKAKEIIEKINKAILSKDFERKFAIEKKAA